jgi:hypothetical protein
MKIYISGKIGEEVLTEATREKFARAERMLRQLGYDVFNPTTSGLGATAEEHAKKHGTTFYREILVCDIIALNLCDAIYMLRDWHNSPGSFVELCFAQATGIDVLFSERADAWDYLNNKFEEEAGTLHTVASRDEFIDSRINDVWLPLKNA